LCREISQDTRGKQKSVPTSFARGPGGEAAGDYMYQACDSGGLMEDKSGIKDMGGVDDDGNTGNCPGPSRDPCKALCMHAAAGRQ